MSPEGSEIEGITYPAERRRPNKHERAPMGTTGHCLTQLYGFNVFMARHDMQVECDAYGRRFCIPDEDVPF